MKKELYWFEENSKFLFSKKLNNNFQMIKFIEKFKKINKAKDFSQKQIDVNWVKNKILNINSMIIEVTEKCNLECEYCPYVDKYNFYDDFRKNSNKNMSWDTFIKSFKYFKNYIINNHNRRRYKEELFFSFYGGEPLIEWKFITEMIKYIEKSLGLKEGNIKFSISTNGVLLTDKIFKFLIRKKNIGMGISFDGLNSKRKFKNGRDSSNIVLTNIRKAIKKYPLLKEKIFLLVTIHPKYNLNGIINLLEELKLDGINNVRISIVSRLNKYPEKEKQIFNLQIKNYYKKFSEKLLNGKLEKLNIFEKSFFLLNFKKFIENKQFFSKKPFAPSLCTPDFFRYFVSVNGDFYICERVPKRFKIGDVENGFNYKKILDLYKQFFTAFKNCHSCKISEFCNLCFATGGENNDLNDNICQITKKYIKDCNSLYHRLLLKRPALINKIINMETK